MKLLVVCNAEEVLAGLKAWLLDNIDREDYCIKHGISYAAPIQQVLWYQTLDKIDELEDLQGLKVEATITTL